MFECGKTENVRIVGELLQDKKTSCLMFSSALVEEIYTAQKVHDEAMIGRMRTANEDRDEAVMKLKHMDVGSDGWVVTSCSRKKKFFF